MTHHEYKENNTFLRPNFKLKEGWEYILTDIATEQYMQPSPPDDDIAYIKEILSSPEYENPFLASGGGRDVFVLPPEAHTSPHPHIVKFPKETPDDAALDGVAQNAHEIFVFNDTESNVILPITAHHTHSQWLIMPLGTPFHELDIANSVTEPFLSDAYDVLGSKIDPTEYKKRNLVSIDSMLYLCDYGYDSQLY
jgi:hypothetical protein